MIGQLVKDSEEATQQLNDIPIQRITGAIRHHTTDDLPSTAVACEMQLMTAMLSLKDEFWQARLRTGKETCVCLRPGYIIQKFRRRLLRLGLIDDRFVKMRCPHAHIKPKKKSVLLL